MSCIVEIIELHGDQESIFRNVAWGAFSLFLIFYICDFLKWKDIFYNNNQRANMQKFAPK